ncbi:hypothetical protein [Methylorubrum aminovorans]
MKDYRFDEQVALLQKKPGDDEPTIRLFLTLREAAHRVATAEEASFERLSSVIIRNGEPLRDIAEIDRIHRLFSGEQQ